MQDYSWGVLYADPYYDLITNGYVGKDCLKMWINSNSYILVINRWLAGYTKKYAFEVGEDYAMGNTTQ